VEVGRLISGALGMESASVWGCVGGRKNYDPLHTPKLGPP
jgi:hypothetical protein